MNAQKLANYISQNDCGYNADQEFVTFVENNIEKLSVFFTHETKIKDSGDWDSVFDITDEILGE